MPKVVVTKWKKPLIGRYKLNADVCAKGNPSPSGGGTLLRSKNRNIVWAIAEFYDMHTNMVAEAIVLLAGLRKR